MKYCDLGLANTVTATPCLDNSQSLSINTCPSSQP